MWPEILARMEICRGVKYNESVQSKCICQSAQAVWAGCLDATLHPAIVLWELSFVYIAKGVDLFYQGVHVHISVPSV